MPVDLGSLTARIGLDNTPLIAGAAAARGELAGLESSGVGSLQRLSDIGRTAFLALGASAAVIGAASLKAASDFQASMELVRTQAGASQGEVDSMTSAILRMASSVGTAPEQLAQALFHIESAGYRGAQALDILRIAAEGAKVGQANLEDVTNALIAVEVSHIKGVSSVSDAMGVLNAIVGVGNVRMGDLAAAMGTGILSAAANFGLSLQDVGGALAVLTDNAVPADEAATRLRMTFSLMAAPTGVAQKALASIGLTQFQLAEDMRHGGLIEAIGDLKTHLEQSGLTATEQAAVLTQAFGGGRTSAAIITLVEQFDRLKQKIGDVGAGAGTFGSSWEATKETFKFQMDQMKAAVDVLAIRIGTVLIPVVTKMAVAVSDAVKWLTQHKDIALALAGVVGGPLLAAMTAFIATELIAAAPVLAVGAAIGLLTAGLILAYEKIGPFHDAVNALGNFLKSTFLAAVDGAQKAWDGFVKGFENPDQKIKVGGIQGLFEKMGQGVKKALDDAKLAWDLFVFGFQNSDQKFDLGGIQGKIVEFGQGAKKALDGAKAAWDLFVLGFQNSDTKINIGGVEGKIFGFGQTVKNVFDGIPGLLSSALSGLQGIFDGLSRFFQEISPKVQEALGHIGEIVQRELMLVGGIFAGIFTGWKAVWSRWGDDIKRIVGDIFDGMKTTIDHALRIIGDIINAVLDLINGDWGKFWNDLKDIPATMFDQLKMVVGKGLDVLKTLFHAAWDEITRGATNAFGLLVNFVKDLPGNIINALGNLTGGLAGAGVDLMTGLFNGLRTGLSTIIGWAGGFASTVAGWFSGAVSWLFNAGSDVLLGLWNGLRTGFQAVINWAGGFFSTMGGWFVGAASWLYNAGIDVITGLLNGMIKALDFLPNIVQRFLGIDVIVKGLKTAVDQLNGAKIDIQAHAETTQAQQALDDLLATMGGIVDYSHPPPPGSGPAAATGGTTHGPTTAGEAGPELVLPLSHLQRARQLLREQGGAITGASGGSAGAMGSNVTNYNLYGPIVASDPAELERQLEARARVAAMAGR